MLVGKRPFSQSPANARSSASSQAPFDVCDQSDQPERSAESAAAKRSRSAERCSLCHRPRQPKNQHGVCKRHRTVPQHESAQEASHQFECKRLENSRLTSITLYYICQPCASADEDCLCPQLHVGEIRVLAESERRELPKAFLDEFDAELGKAKSLSAPPPKLSKRDKERREDIDLASASAQELSATATAQSLIGSFLLSTFKAEVEGATNEKPALLNLIALRLVCLCICHDCTYWLDVTPSAAKKIMLRSFFSSSIWQQQISERILCRI